VEFKTSFREEKRALEMLAAFASQEGGTVFFGDEFFPTARADTLTTSEHLGVELQALQAAGTTDVVLYPTSGGLEQVGLLAEGLQNTGFLPAHVH
jgi:hypothetical protein